MVHKSKALDVAIVIPVYNEAAYLPACLEAIAAQTEMPAEVIIVDNNSTDASRQIAARYDFVRVIAEPKQGMNYASWRGCQAAESDIIGRIDADTRVCPDWVATVKRYFETHPSVSALTGKCYFYDFPLPRLTSAFHALFEQYLQRLIAGTSVLWASNTAIRRSVWHEVAGEVYTGPEVYEDIDLTLVLHKHGFVIRRNTALKVRLSMLRGDITWRSFWRYMDRWAPSYHVNNLFFRTQWIRLLRIVTMIIFLPVPVIAWIDQRVKRHRISHKVA